MNKIKKLAENFRTLYFEPRPRYKIFFCPVLQFCSFFPSSSLFLPPHVILFFSRRQTNERTNERANQRTNGNSPFLTSCSSFAYHYKLFVICIVPLSFDTRLDTTIATTIATTTMLVSTPPLPHVAQKGPF
jgi:hypothetical protein